MFHWFTVVDKVMVKQDWEFEVITVDQEGGWRAVKTQTPVNMEGNPASTKLIYTLNLPCFQLLARFYIASHWKPYAGRYLVHRRGRGRAGRNF